MPPFFATLDPPVRDDGLCAVCSEPRQPERSSRYARQEAVRDPFCSSDCARRFHGTEVRSWSERGLTERVRSRGYSCR